MSGLVEAARFTWAYQAELARTFLESHCVTAFVFDAGTSLYAEGAITGVRLMVMEDDAADVGELMQDYER